MCKQRLTNQKGEEHNAQYPAMIFQIIIDHDVKN